MLLLLIHTLLRQVYLKLVCHGPNRFHHVIFFAFTHKPMHR